MSADVAAFVAMALGAIWACPKAGASELQSFPEAQYVATEFGDGDSFKVRFPNPSKGGKIEEHVVRLYFVDCAETSLATESDRRRAVEQARYFGLEHAHHIVTHGKKATAYVEKLLGGKDTRFTVHTAFASGRGRSEKHELVKVRGIGPATVAKVRDYLTVSPKK